LRWIPVPLLIGYRFPPTFGSFSSSFLKQHDRCRTFLFLVIAKIEKKRNFQSLPLFPNGRRRTGLLFPPARRTLLSAFISSPSPCTDPRIGADLEISRRPPPSPPPSNFPTPFLFSNRLPCRALVPSPSRECQTAAILLPLTRLFSFFFFMN